jgi:hypothetical protein
MKWMKKEKILDYFLKLIYSKNNFPWEKGIKWKVQPSSPRKKD